MRDKVNALRNDPFWRHNAVFLVGNVAVGFLNYIFYPVMGRLLAPTYFGEVQTLFSVIAHVNVFFNVLGLVVVNLVANKDQNDVTHSKATKTIIELEKFSLLFSIGIFAIFLLLITPVKSFFQFGSVWPLLAGGITILLAVPFTFRRGILQGYHDFAGLSWAGIVNALLKLALAIGMVWAGFKTGGVVLALALAQLLSLWFIMWRLRARRLSYAVGWKQMGWPNMKLVRPQLAYAGVGFVVSLIFTVQYSIDLLSTKHYFSPRDAGLYAGISTIANIIFYATGSVAGVLFANVHIGRRQENRRLLWRSLRLCLLVGGGSLLLFTLLPKFIIRLLIGSTYVDYAHYLPREGLALLIVAVANLLYVYYMAQRQHAISWLAGLGAVLTVALMYFNHASITAIINNVIIGSLTLLLSICLFGWAKRQTI